MQNRNTNRIATTVMAIVGALSLLLTIPSTAYATHTSTNWTEFKLISYSLPVNPYGIHTVEYHVHKLKSDGSSTYDYYMYYMIQQSEGGDHEWGTGWTTHWTKTRNYLYSGGQLHDDGPDQDYGVGSGSASVSVSAGGVGVSYTYPLNCVAVDWNSSYSSERAEWTHTIPYSWCSEAGNYVSKPSFVARVSQGQAVDGYGYNTAEYNDWSGSTWYDLNINRILDAYSSL